MNTQTKHIVLLIIRILVGGLIAWAGVQKLMNMESTVAMFGAYFGLSLSITWAVSVGELLAGLGILFGVYTQVASAGAAIIMAGAVYYTKGAMLTPIFLLIGAVVLIFTGSGKFALKPCPCSIDKVQQ